MFDSFKWHRLSRDFQAWFQLEEGWRASGHTLVLPRGIPGTLFDRSFYKEGFVSCVAFTALVKLVFWTDGWHRYANIVIAVNLNHAIARSLFDTCKILIIDAQNLIL